MLRWVSLLTSKTGEEVPVEKTEPSKKNVTKGRLIIVERIQDWGVSKAMVSVYTSYLGKLSDFYFELFLGTIQTIKLYTVESTAYSSKLTLTTISSQAE